MADKTPDRTKTITLRARVGVHDIGSKDPSGPVRWAEPGEAVTFPADEADRLLNRFGGVDQDGTIVEPLDPASTDATRLAGIKPKV